MYQLFVRSGGEVFQLFPADRRRLPGSYREHRRPMTDRPNDAAADDAAERLALQRRLFRHRSGAFSAVHHRHPALEGRRQAAVGLERGQRVARRDQIGLRGRCPPWRACSGCRRRRGCAGRCPGRRRAGAAPPRSRPGIRPAAAAGSPLASRMSPTRLWPIDRSRCHSELDGSSPARYSAIASAERYASNDPSRSPSACLASPSLPRLTARSRR